MTTTAGAERIQPRRRSCLARSVRAGRAAGASAVPARSWTTVTSSSLGLGGRGPRRRASQQSLVVDHGGDELGGLARSRRSHLRRLVPDALDGTGHVAVERRDRPGARGGGRCLYQGRQRGGPLYVGGVGEGGGRPPNARDGQPDLLPRP